MPGVKGDQQIAQFLLLAQCVDERILLNDYLSIYRHLLDLGRFLFLNPEHSRQDPLDWGSARRKAATYTQNNTNTEKTHRDMHASSGIRTHDPSVLAKTVYALDRTATVIGFVK
jgi:hypothetical protein